MGSSVHKVSQFSLNASKLLSQIEYTCTLRGSKSKTPSFTYTSSNKLICPSIEQATSQTLSMQTSLLQASNCVPLRPFSSLLYITPDLLSSFHCTRCLELQVISELWHLHIPTTATNMLLPSPQPTLLPLPPPNTLIPTTQPRTHHAPGLHGNVETHMWPRCKIVTMKKVRHSQSVHDSRPATYSQHKPTPRTTRTQSPRILMKRKARRERRRRDRREDTTRALRFVLSREMRKEVELERKRVDRGRSKVAVMTTTRVFVLDSAIAMRVRMRMSPDGAVRIWMMRRNMRTKRRRGREFVRAG